jgi:hypothetical protein
MFVSSLNLRNLLTKFAQILEILNSIFKPTLDQKFSRIKVYNALALPILLYAREIWALRKKDKKTIHINRDELFRTDGNTVYDHKRNKEILEDLQVEPFDEKLRR